MLTVTYGDIFQAKGAIQELIKLPWPMKTATRIAKLHRRINEAYSEMELLRIVLVERYGEKNPLGRIQVTNDLPGWEDFVREFNNLMAQEVEVETIRVPLPDIEADIQPSVLIALDPFIESAWSDDHVPTDKPELSVVH